MAYESAHTKFMRDWMQQHPEEKAVQQSGRALWWERGARNLDEQARLAAAQVPHKPYPYDNNG